MNKTNFFSKTNELINNTLVKNIFTIIFSISNSLLAVYLMIGTLNRTTKIITMFVTFFSSAIYLYKEYNNIIEKIKYSKILSVFALVFSALVFYGLINTQNIQVLCSRVLNIKLLFCLSFGGMSLLIILVFIAIKEWVSEFIKSMDRFEKKAYIITSLVMFVLILITYMKTDYFYLQYDKVYSLDSGWVYNKILPNIYYYDIRHPLMSIFTFPIYALVNFIFSASLKPVILQFINIQLLILVGLELKRMTKNNFVYIFYILSFPSILFSLFFEKYILCIFLVVTYLYNIFIRKQSSNKLLVFIAGTMPTNIFIAVSEFFRTTEFKEKLKNIISIGIISLVVVIMTGRVHCLFNGYDEMKNMKDRFGVNNFSVTEKFNSTTKMVEHSFIAIDSHKQADRYIWNNVTNSTSYVGIVIIIVMLVGVKDIFERKNKIYFSFLLSFVFSVALFMVLNWSVHESPLFSICFSWAIIPLFIFGLEKIFSLLKIKEKKYEKIYYVLILIIIAINVNEVMNIFRLMII